MDRLLTRVAVSLATLVVVMLMTFFAMICFGVAAYLALRAVLSPTLAAFVTGIAALLFALVVGMAGRTLSARRHSAARGQYAAACEAELADLLGKEIAALIRGHASASVVASLMAGIVVGMSPALRKGLRGLLRG